MHTGVVEENELTKNYLKHICCIRNRQVEWEPCSLATNL